MVTSQRSTALVAAVLLLTLTSTIEAMDLYFNDRFMRFSFETTQRCFTIAHCWDDHSADMEWKGLPNPSQLVVFENDHCQGQNESVSGPKGAVDLLHLRDGVLYNKVSSFMVMEYSKYPLNGIVDHCHEYAAFNSTRASASGSDEGGEAAGFARNASLGN
ncbi:hypothetical protein BBJ28_00006012 [Nothophytophthora sp. Chile5]|nr:hypothetical protein BBJ28_00006012 [Nothophytophthora sp. Chile5]